MSLFVLFVILREIGLYNSQVNDRWTLQSMITASLEKHWTSVFWKKKITSVFCNEDKHELEHHITLHNLITRQQNWTFKDCFNFNTNVLSSVGLFMHRATSIGWSNPLCSTLCSHIPAGLFVHLLTNYKWLNNVRQGITLLQYNDQWLFFLSLRH